MSSASQLEAGRKASLGTLKGQWLAYNSSRGHQIHVSQNISKPKARHLSVCYSAPKTGWKKAQEAPNCCSAHLKAIGPNQDEMTIVSVELDHTCQPLNTDGRKRNHMTKDVATISDTALNYEPTKKKEGNTAQCIGMTQKATGIILKSGQAARAVRSLSHDTIAAQIGQHMLLPSLFSSYSQDDFLGTYKLESKECSFDGRKRQFKRCYVCLSIAKHFWKYACIKMWVVDGTFTRLRAFKHIILLAVTFDGNNQVIALAFAIVDVENADNWIYFKDCLEEDFPGCRVWMSDADKGVESNDFDFSLSQSDDPFEKSRCVQHLSKNCHEHNTGKMNEDHKQMIRLLAKARTENLYQQRLQAIDAANDGWATWLDHRKDEFSTVSFLQKGIRRWGKITSNAVENTNSALVSQRSLPIMHMIQGIVQCQMEKHSERKLQAQRWALEGKTLTLFADNEDTRIGEIASKREVRDIEENHPVYTANASVDSPGWNAAYVKVSVNVDTHKVECPCLNVEECGASCYHGKALLMKLGNIGKGFKWYHKRHHASTYLDSYEADIPCMGLAGFLSHDDSFYPPDHKRSAGRPKKKRKDRTYLRKTGVRRLCYSCGKRGHFGDGCEDPNTECRVKNQLVDAVEH